MTNFIIIALIIALLLFIVALIAFVFAGVTLNIDEDEVLRRFDFDKRRYK